MHRFVLTLTLLGLTTTAVHAQPKFRVYVGTYTGKVSKGIYRLEMDGLTGALSKPELAVEIPSPSFLAIHPNRQFLYSVNEVGNFDGKPAGAISSFSIDKKTGNLTLLNQQSSGGGGPCHLVVDTAGKNVLTANYGGGSAGVLPILTDGKLGPMSSFIQHKGSGANPKRQKEPHAHSINLDPANKYAFVADLGLDKVLIYKFDGAKGTITPNNPPSVSVSPGAGPRHFAFHPSGRFAYVINELHNTVDVLSYIPANGEMVSHDTPVSTLPKDFKGTSYTAEVVVHPSGKFLYGSNRGHNSIAVFAIDQETGKLRMVDIQAKGINTPRNFAVDPTGKYLLVANQGGNSIVVFRIDDATGNLTPTQHQVEVPTPVCIRFLQLK